MNKVQNKIICDWEKNYRGIYNSWNGMLRRCYNPKSPYYKDYGGRGIRVSEEWKKFDIFLQEMLPTWKKGLTLERTDNNGNYCKENCRWATREEQANNRRSSKFILYKGEVKTLTSWIKLLGLKPSIVRQQLYCY